MKYRVGLSDTKNNRFKAASGYRSRRTNSVSRYASGVRNMKRFGTREPIRSTSTKSKLKLSANWKKKLTKAIYAFIGIGFFLGLFGIIGGGIYLKQLEASLPDPNKLVDRSSDMSTQIFDKSGKLLYTIYGDQNREFVKIEDIPEHTKWALLAAEDIEFYQHKGIDIAAIAKSAYTNIVLKDTARGASTISQQLVKNTLLFDILGDEAYEKSYSRKIKEILITMQMEKALSKDEILQMYMNEVPLGGVNYGYQTAAKTYFGKNVKDLSLAESALLAGIISNSSIYSPLFGTRPDLAKMRQEYVLDQMLKHKDLTGVTEEQIKAAREEKLVYKSAGIDIKAPHFVFYVKQLLIDEFGADRVERGGLKVTTTLDLSVQKIAEEEITNGIKNYGKRWNVNNGAMIVIDPKTGDIISMVGSVDYNKTDDPKIDGNVNVTISPRQMGSSVKPYTYLTAFHQGYGPWLVVPDIKEVSFGAYKLANWDNRYSGLMTARQGLIQSRNIPAVYTLQLVGIDNFIQTAETLGISTLTHRDQYGLSLTLGTAEMSLLEHAGAFSVFANGGVKKDIRAILKVEDQKGNVIMEAKENKGKKVWDEREIYALNWILCDIGGFRDQPNDKYYHYNGRRSFCGKTGTTNGPKDLVSMFYDKSLVVGVWAGNNNNIETPGAWSTTVPLPIASSFRNRIAGKYKPETFTRPAGIVATQVCADTGDIAGKDTNCKKVSSIYITGKSPKPDKRTSMDICKANNKIPSNLEMAKQYGGTYQAYVLNKVLENKLQQNAYDRYMQAIKSPKYLAKEPEIADCPLPLGPDNAPLVDITSPQNGASVPKGGNITIQVSAVAQESIANVEFYFDGTQVGNTNSAPYKQDYTIPDSVADGSHTIMVKVNDNQGRSSTDSVVINVGNSNAGLTVTLTKPSAPTYTSMPIELSASLSNDSGVDKVEFVITKVGGGYTDVRTDSSAGGGWSENWNDGSAPNGVYRVFARAYKGSSTYDSGVANFALSR